MYLTKLNLKRLNRSVIKSLSDVYRLHQTVMKGFTAYTEIDRVLYRVEPEEQNGMVSILVQSTVLPDWSKLGEESHGAVSARVKEFSVGFQLGQRYRFRLRANPTVTREGKRLGLVRDESLLEWLEKKQDRLGMRFCSMTAIDEGYLTGSKEHAGKQHRLSLKAARFEGVLEVMDAETLTSAFVSGIGPAKAFGCGLLSLARA
jgi:CRISPR system Cascade subunit CasE